MKKQTILLLVLLIITPCLAQLDYSCSLESEELTNVENTITSNISQGYPGLSFSNNNFLCYTINNINYYSGTIIGREDNESINGTLFVYEMTKAGEEYTITSIITEEYYNYSLFFSETELEILGQEVQKRIVSYENTLVDDSYWISITPQSMTDCDSFELNFNTLSGEKHFKNYENYCAGYLYTNSSLLRGLTTSWTGNIFYFGENIMFEYLGRANTTAGLNTVLGNISDCETCNIKDECYINPPEGLNHSCYTYYYDKDRIFITKNLVFENISMSINVIGLLDSSAVLSVYGWMTNSSSNKLIINEAITNFTNGFFGQEKQIPYYSSPQDYYLFFTGNTSLKKATLNNEVLEGLENNFHETARTYYREPDIYITLGKEYVTIITYEDDWVKDYTTFTNNTVSTTAFLHEPDESLARLIMSGKTTPYITINESDWIVDYYVVPDTDWHYLGGIGVQDYLIEKTGFAIDNPARNGVFRDEFSEILGTYWMIESTKQLFRTLFTIIWLICTVIVAFMFLRDAQIRKIKI